MKILKKATDTADTRTIKEAFRLRTKVTWSVPFFDGRITWRDVYTGTVVKVNRKTVDVIVDDTGDLARLDAYKKADTGKWALS